jgi:hypothetical protein
MNHSLHELFEAGRGCVEPLVPRPFIIIPRGNVGGDFDSFDELVAGHSVLALISIKQGQTGGPLEMVMHRKGIMEVNILWLVSHFRTCSFSSL